MSKQLRKHWPAILLTLTACAVMYMEYQAVPAYRRFSTTLTTPAEDSFFIAMGKWGIRFLLLSLAATPIYTLTGWRFPARLRKTAGLLAFAFVSVHVGIHLVSPGGAAVITDFFIQPQYIVYGGVAFAILFLMALTSVKVTMKLAGRYWKPLHRLVYLAGILMMLHALIAATYTKRAAINGPASAEELKVYLYIMLALLFVRIPAVKDWLRSSLPFAPFRHKRKRKRKPEPEAELSDLLA